MKHIFETAIAAACATAAALCAVSCKIPDRGTVREDRTVKVKVQEVSATRVSTAKTYIGKVKSGTEVNVNSPFPSNLQHLSASQGEKVSKGQVLASVWSETVESSYSAAEATLRQAQDAYSRIEKVKDDGSVSEIKKMEVKTQLARAQAAYNSARKAREDCQIKAPFDGTVSEVLVNEGEDLTLLQPILKIVDLTDLELEISVPEGEVAGLNISDKATAEIPAIPGCVVRASLEKKGVTASGLSHNYTCTLHITDYPSTLMPGMIGKVRFEEAAGGSCIIIPASAIRSDRDGRYVWTVNGQSRVEKKHITTSEFARDGVIVSSGLQEGDAVITDGIAKVSTGMKVSIR